MPYYVDHVHMTYLMMSQIYPSPTLQSQPEKRKRRQKGRERDLVTNYYPPGPTYVASYEVEDAPALLNNLILIATSEENIQIIWKKARLQKTKETG